MSCPSQLTLELTRSELKVLEGVASSRVLHFEVCQRLCGSLMVFSAYSLL